MSITQVGPYRIVRQIGEGGMGAVYEALHTGIERRVAIKLLHAEFSRDRGVIQRFFNEARAVNVIDHPGVVQVSEYSQLPDGTAYIVMELLQGQTLSKRLLAHGGTLPISIMLRIMLQLAGILSAAHKRGIVHRDLKPDNIMLVPDPLTPNGERLKILDFGIAKLAEVAQGDDVRTKTGIIMGTPRYMSPEQCRGIGIDDRADVYSLGVIIFQALAGRAPFVAGSTVDVIAMHLFKPPPSLAEVCPEMPPKLDELVAVMLSKDSALRPRMSEIEARLTELSRKYPDTSMLTSEPCSGSSTDKGLTLASSIGERVRVWPRARSGAVFLVLSVAAVLVAGRALRPRVEISRPNPDNTSVTLKASTTNSFNGAPGVSVVSTAAAVPPAPTLSTNPELVRLLQPAPPVNKPSQGPSRDQVPKLLRDAQSPGSRKGIAGRPAKPPLGGNVKPREVKGPSNQHPAGSGFVPKSQSIIPYGVSDG